ncbi:protein of unknown function [Methanococcoides vulcani]|uniref:DUF4349 domain-containing protein n=1 Tax=Methanococcoides vulcani TaxID=1353158 RepID=A0A1H9ZB90_9EURY|nr:DUF4349 domain-containing protein [Methanococcoides vulcani]SES78805.1 protein of unknown function [Methanococcoides vulcani]
MKRTYPLLFIFLLTCVIAAGCLSTDSNTQSYAPQEESFSFGSKMAEMAADEAWDVSDDMLFDVADSGEATGSSITRKVITTSDVSLEVKNASEAVDSIGAIASEYDGYVSSSSVYDTYYGDSESMSGYISIRVPAVEHDAVLDRVEALGKVTSKSTSGVDVTEEYIDVEARLSNLEKQELRLQEILDMATTVEDVLEVEKELGRVRGEIESLTGRLNYLKDRVEFSTITVSVTEPRNITHSWGLRDALSDSVRGFIASVNGIIVFIGIALPIVIFLTIVGSVVIFAKRRVWR